MHKLSDPDSSYNQTIRELFDLQKFAIKLGLDNIRALSERLHHPHRAYPVIHVAGTNGKGSTSFFIAKILEAHGLKTGLFTSPHLADFRERITVGGTKIMPSAIEDFWKQHKKFILQHKATFFDTTAAMALDYFRNQKVDVAVIETGLGGRLDSTNIVKPHIVVLTPIDFDHEKQLGGTLEQIATEKAGIIKAGAAVFSAQQPEQALSVFKNHINPGQSFSYLPDWAEISVEQSTLNKTVYTLQDKLRRSMFHRLHTRQAGNYQTFNQSLAYTVSRHFLELLPVPFSESAFRSALANQLWPGRLQLISRHPDVVLDVSHNPAGIETSFSFISKERRPVNTLIGLVEDKNYKTIAAIVSRYSRRIIITEPDTHRKLSAETLQTALASLKKESEIIKDSVTAFELLKKESQPNDIVLAIGSHYLIGRLLQTGK